MANQRPVGLIGIGLMGEALVERLVPAGFAVLGFDIDPEKTKRLAAHGGRPAASIDEIARAADPIVVAVFSTDQVEAVVERELLPVLGENSDRIVLCTSTCDPDRTAALHGRVAMRGLRVVRS